jgi:hypothetical protein
MYFNENKNKGKDRFHQSQPGNFLLLIYRNFFTIFLTQRDHLQVKHVYKITKKGYWVMDGLHINEISFVQYIGS